MKLKFGTGTWGFIVSFKLVSLLWFPRVSTFIFLIV